MNNKILFILFIGILTFMTACEKDLVVYTEGNEVRNDALTDIIVNTPVVSFVAGNPEYTLDILVRTPNNDDTKAIDVYNTFTDATTGESSEPVLLGSYSVEQGANTTNIIAQVTYEDLKAGVTVNGGPLPDAETDVAVGSSWVLTFSPNDGSGGETFTSGSKIIVSVLSPFAGIYRVLESAYFRIGIESGSTDWSGTEIFIGSVDANTFSHNDWWGPFDSPGFFVFDLNEDNTITIPDVAEQLFFSGDDMLTCQEDSGSFQNVSCDGSNVLEVKEDGKHIIKLTYGYYTASGDENEGAREFYEVLEKIN